MKKILSMAALALVMAGCSNDDENVKIDNGEATNAVAIQISQKVAGVESKAAITPGADMLATIIMVDGANSSASNPDFSSFTPKTQNTLTGAGNNTLADDAARANVANTEFKAQTTAQGITLTPTLYYPVESGASAKKTWILGVAPQGVVNGLEVAFSQADGLQDVMFAEKQDAGNGNGSATPVTLEFKHKTTQLTFVAKLTNDDLSETEWKDQTVGVKSIIIPNAKVPEKLNISSGNITWTDKEITVAGCAEALKLTSCKPSVPVMIASSQSLIVNIILSGGNKTITYNNLKVKNSAGQDLATVEAKSHEITFEITPPKKAEGATLIEASAKIVDWTAGDPGKVEIK